MIEAGCAVVPLQNLIAVCPSRGENLKGIFPVNHLPAVAVTADVGKRLARKGQKLGNVRVPAEKRENAIVFLQNSTFCSSWRMSI